MQRQLLINLIFLIGTALPAQSPFTADYHLPDGVYLSHAAVLAAQPDLPWEAISGEMVQLPEEFRLQISDYQYKNSDLDPDLVPYAVSLEGQLYLFLRNNRQRNYHDFVGLSVAGTLSVITYDTTIQTRQLMKAYNPINGRPFREAYVERSKTVPLTKLWHLPSGQLVPLSRADLLAFIGDDQELTQALLKLVEVTQDLLLRAVKLYDDRHPTLIGQTP